MNRVYVLLLVSALFFPIDGNSQDLSAGQIQQLAERQFPEAVEELRQFLTIPNDGHFPEQAEANRLWCVNRFKELGFEVTTLETGGIPLLFAQKDNPQAAKTVLFYLQIDGQPVDPREWNQPDPFQPVLKSRKADGSWEIQPWPEQEETLQPDWRIFGRSSSDSKGPAMCFITALEILKQEKMDPNCNIKVIMDFQEEMGSPTTPGAVQTYTDLLAADMLIIMDGTRHVSNLPTLAFGARGIAKITLTVFGPKVPLHSGQYGNYAPNPAFRLAKLLGDLKDDSGRVTIPGFYDGIEFSAEERAILNNVPEDPEAINRRLGIARPEQVGATFQEALQYPTLNIRGMKAAWVGEEVRTIIPDKAIAELDLRLVPESDPERLISLIRQHILDQGFHFVDQEPTGEERSSYDKLIAFDASVSYKAFRTAYDSELGIWLNKALTRTFGKQPVRMRTTGGSQPMSPFITTLGVDAVSVRIPNPDNNIHSPNENFRLGNYLEGIQTCLGILTEPLH